MEELIRCPSCRGSKKVAKLGGIVGDCNSCDGSGKIKACDKPKPIVSIVEPVVNEVLAQVENVTVPGFEHDVVIQRIATPNQIDELEPKPDITENVADIITQVQKVSEVKEPITKPKPAKKLFKAKR